MTVIEMKTIKVLTNYLRVRVNRERDFRVFHQNFYQWRLIHLNRLNRTY